MARVKRPKRKSKAQLKAEREARAEQRRTDRVLILVAEEKLANFNTVRIKPDALREILTRYIKLAKPNAERRQPGRPRNVLDIGMMVELRIGADKSKADPRKKQAEARKKIARHLRMSLGAVRRAHNRYLAQRRGDKTQS